VEAYYYILIVSQLVGSELSEKMRLYHLTFVECREWADKVALKTGWSASCLQDTTRPVPPAVCPFFGGCWRDGRRCLDGALCQRRADY
jgi:hypothetical protein